MTARQRILSCLVICAFQFTTVFTAQNSFAAMPTVLDLPAPGTMVNLSSKYVPTLIKAVHINPDNPLLFDFIVDTGNTGINSDTPQLRKESEKLIKYFLATLTVPEKNLWVNLSPYEKERIINGSLGQTELGRDMLAQDYMLKQLTASMLYPEKSMGRKFWNNIYAQAQELFGTSQIPINTFNKVWILPDSATIFVRDNTAYLLEGHMKVMLEEDYLAMNQNMGGAADAPKTNTVGNKIVRQILLPAIENEVNNGKNFAQLRQIFNSVVLAAWYKRNLKQALLNQVYSDRAKINGVNVDDKKIAEKIYRQYQAAYKKGVFNYIKEDYDRLSQQAIPRKYFSGGVDFTKDEAMAVRNPTLRTDPAQLTPREFDAGRPVGETFSVLTALEDAALIGKKGTNYKDLIADALNGEQRERPSVADKAMTNDERQTAVRALSGKVPAVVLKDVQDGVVATPRQAEALRLLVDAGQQQVLESWASHPPQERAAFLDQVSQLNDAYSGGIGAYRTNGVKLLAQSAKGESAFAGFEPQVPRGTDLTRVDQQTFENMEEEGLKDFNRTVAVLPAGGQGDRLGYDGIKVGIPLDMVTGKPYLQNYVENILALQSASNKIKGEQREVPLVIMTSDATHDATVKLLKDNNYFGMNGMTVNPTKEQVAKGDVQQIIILKQNMVPAMQNNNGDFVLAPGDKYRLEVKAHGHGDIHMLIHQTGLDQRFAKEGNSHLLFFQDTNGQAFNAVLPGIANSVQHNYGMNFLTTSREAGEAAGAIVQMKSPDGRNQTMNVEYNELGPFLKSVSTGRIPKATLDQISTGAGRDLLTNNLLGEESDNYVIEGKNIPAIEARLTSEQVPQAKEIMAALNKAVPGDVPDVNTGKSPFPANLNVFIVKADVYKDKLAQTGGIFGEFINPKYKDATRQEFQAPTRTETMMQDIAKSLPGDEVGFTNFPRGLVFSPVKNSIARAQSVVGPDKKVPADAMPTGEADFYKTNREKLALAGVDIDVEGNTQEVQGIPFQAGAKVVLSRSFAPIQADLKGRFEGKNTISPTSTFVVDGPGAGGVKFSNLTLDGTLKVNAAEGVSVMFRDMNVKNAGTVLVPLSADELKDTSIPQAERMRGYRMVERAATTIDIPQPGSYEVTPQDVTLRVPVINEAAAKDKLRLPISQAAGNQSAFQGLVQQISATVGQPVPADRDIVVVLEGSKEVPLKSLAETPEAQITGVTFNFQDKSKVSVNIAGPQPVLQMRAKVDNLPQRLGNIAQSIFDDQIARPDRAMSGSPAERRTNTSVSTPLKAISGGYVPGARGSKEDVGGIDLNSANMTTKIFGERMNIRFDPAMIAQFKRGDFTGVRPEILRVTPIPSVLPLFGISSRREEQGGAVLAKV